MAVLQYGDKLRESMGRWQASPIPRHMYARMGEQELADEIQRLYTWRKGQMFDRYALDLRLLRWYDPERLQDQWQSMWTGRYFSKLSHSNGLSVEIYNWCKPIIDGMVGLLAGYKPFPYNLIVPPEEPASEPELLHSDIVEKLLLRSNKEGEYLRTYTDHVRNIVSLGRSWKYVTWDNETKRPRRQILWPGHVAGFWQADQRTLEQVTIATSMSAGEAVDLYPEYERDIMLAAESPNSAGAGDGNRESPYDHVTILNHWFRAENAKIGHIAVLTNSIRNAMGPNGSRSQYLEGTLNSEYEDIPARCTPRGKIMDKTPDEATGALMQIAPLNSEYNEVMSASRDMLWRVIYQRYKAKGFTFRNAPRLIPGTAIYALPRPDQDIARIEEIVNTVPVEQFTNHSEEMMIVHPGMNRFFIGSAPPSETSGESIKASINASITQLEPQRTEIGTDEMWDMRMQLGLFEKFGHYELPGGITVRLSAIIEGKRDVDIQWADANPSEATKMKQIMLAASAAGKVSDDTLMTALGVQSIADEKRKLRTERQDPWMHPEAVSQWAAATVAKARARAMEQNPMAALGGGDGGQGGGNMQMQGAEAARTNAARGTPPPGENQNQANPALGPGQVAALAAPPPPGQGG